MGFLAELSEENGVLGSGKSSDVSLIFVPGAFNTCIWKHQLSYFARGREVYSFTEEIESVEAQREEVKHLIESSDSDFIIVTHFLSFKAVEGLERRENVRKVVLSGNPGSELRSYVFDSVLSLSLKHAKLAKTLLFHEATRYSVAKEFVESVELESDVGSWLSDFEIDDRVLRVQGDGGEGAVIERTAVFPFFEKPQEFNKVLSDLVLQIQRLVKEQRIEAKQNRNKTLEDFKLRRVEK